MRAKLSLISFFEQRASEELETGLGLPALAGKGSVMFLGEKPSLVIGLAALESGE